MSVPRPNFLIVGVAKCGTTALASILGAHPDCCMSNPKETCFFTKKEFDEDYNSHLAWYESCWSHYKGEKFIGEATPAYANRRPDNRTVNRIFGFNPDMKIILMARDPLEKQMSAWKMYYYMGLNRRFSEKVQARWAMRGFDYYMRKTKETGQWRTCLFSDQLEAYAIRFPAEHICVSFLEDWMPDKWPEVSRIMGFLGLDPEKWEESDNLNENKASLRMVNRPLVRAICSTAAGAKVISLIPEGLKRLGRPHFGAVPVEYDPVKAQLSSRTRQEFKDFVSADARRFLAAHGKSPDFWKSVAASG